MISLVDCTCFIIQTKNRDEFPFINVFTSRFLVNMMFQVNISITWTKCEKEREVIESSNSWWNHYTWMYRHNRLFACPWDSKRSSTISFNFELVCLSLHAIYEIQKWRYWIINKAPHESKSILWWFVYTPHVIFFITRKRRCNKSSLWLNIQFNNKSRVVS